MIRIKKIELELSDKSVLSIEEQKAPVSLKNLSNIIIKSIFTHKLQTATGGGTEFAQWDTAREIGMKSTSTIYRAVRGRELV